MADIKARGVTTGKARVGNNVQTDVTCTRDGALYVADYKLACALEGKLFTAQVGTLTTPTTFRIGIDADQPELVIDVPSGTTIVPVFIRTYLEDAAGTDNEIVAQANPALCGAATSTAGTIIPARLGSGASQCKFYYTYAGNCTVPANFVEFYRDGDAFAQAAATPKKLYTWRPEEGVPVVIAGPGSLVLYVDGTGTAPAGYLLVGWLEFLSSEV